MSATTNKTPNEAAYGFTPVATLDLWRLDIEDPTVIDQAITKLAVRDTIAFGQMRAKYYYDQTHIPLNLQVG